MSAARAIVATLLAGAACASGCGVAVALELPPTCRAGPPLVADETTPLAGLREQVETTFQTDPDAAIRLLCATIPRVAREAGEDSVEMAWWVGSLATPLIVIKNAYAEAIPLLEFARPIFEKRLGPNAAEVADIHVAYAWIRFRQGLLAESRAAWESALKARENNPGPGKVELQKALVGLAQVQMAQRDFAAARASLDRAKAILAGNDATISEAAAAIENVYTNICLREENYAEARRHAETQIAIESRLGGGAPQLVPAYALLGQVLERLDEYEASERALREAVRLAESAGGPLQRHLLSALTTLGGFLDDRGNPVEALAFDIRALEVGTATLGPGAPKLVRVLHNLADAHLALGHLPEALRAYEQAQAIVAAHPADVELQARVAGDRGYGALLTALGETEEARIVLRRGLATAGDDSTLSTDRADLLVALAQTSSDPRDPGRRESLTRALSLYRARLPGTHPTILRVINALCGLEIDHDPAATPACAEAATRLEEAREIEPALREAVLGNQSRLAGRRGDRDTSERLAVRALAAAASLGTPDPLWRAQDRLARLLHARRENTLAIFFGKSALAQIERLRGTLVGDDRRFDHDFLRDKIAVYRAVADWLMESGRIDDGLAILALLKDEELYDFALRGAPSAPDGPSVALTPAEQALLDRYREAVAADAVAGGEINRLSRLRQAGRLSVAEAEDLDRRLTGQKQAETERAGRLQGFITASGAAVESPVAPAGRTIETAALKAEARRLGADSALACYLLTDTHLRILVATRHGEREHRIPVDAGALRRDIGLFLDAIGRREDVRARAQSLYETIARPVDEAARLAGAQRLVLWPDGALRYVPFAALHDGRRYLAEAYSIELRAGGMVPATATPTGVAPAGAPAPLRVRGLGVTQAVGGFRPLPAVGDELCYVVNGPIAGLAAASAACPDPGTGDGALAGAGFADAAFTRERVDTLFSGPRDFSVVHLGTHFSLRPGNALRSFLVLGDGSKLTLDAIGGLDFSGIELLTLSACQTGLGGADSGDGREVEGLGALVARRGARRVVASLWEVEDASTSTLMRSMYRALRSEPDDPARALQRAQSTLRTSSRGGRHPYEHPYYWAGFAVSGSAPRR